MEKRYTEGQINGAIRPRGTKSGGNLNRYGERINHITGFAKEGLERLVFGARTATGC